MTDARTERGDGAAGDAERLPRSMRHVGVRALIADRRRAEARLARFGPDPAVEAILERIDAALAARRDDVFERRSRDAPPEVAGRAPAAAPCGPSDAALRARWRDLVGRRLPALAAERRWPVRADHCFARILLDAAVGAPWRTRIAPPAWRNAPAPVLKEAVRLGEAAVAGMVDLGALNRRSRAMRGEAGRVPARASDDGRGRVAGRGA